MGVEKNYNIKLKRKKGQVFVAGAILILVLIAAMVISLKYTYPQYDKFLGKKMDNIEREVRFSSFSKEESISEFSSYLQKDVNGFRDMFLIAEYTSGNLRITVGNYLNSKTSFNISSNQFNQTIVLDNNQTTVVQYTTSGQVNLKLQYDIGSEKSQEDLLITEGRTVFIDFMIKDNDFLRRKVIYHTE
ncbi:MAG: hypothetical protein HY831_05050 [Candidatus Aenigmarchaeota archaeon]|nr:hypothetical protein [Candidatus Aenigmarchaeota archaeon]